jgi:hypothetical protein
MRGHALVAICPATECALSVATDLWNWPNAAELCVEKNAEGTRCAGHRACGTRMSTMGWIATVASTSRRIAGSSREIDMHQLIYIVGLIVVILAILSFFGLR